jgi:O-antigen/teichoic acid export membrane protein
MKLVEMCTSSSTSRTSSKWQWLTFVGRTASVYGLRLGTAAASFASAAALARLLGSEHYGEYIYLLTLASLLAQVFSFGAIPLMTRGIAQARGANDPSARADHIGRAGVVIVLATLLTMGGMGLGGLFFAASRSGSLTAWLAAGLSGTLGLWLSYYSGLLAGFERVLPAQFAHAAVPSFAALFAGLLWMLALPAELVAPELGFAVQITAVTATLALLLPITWRIRSASFGVIDLRYFRINNVATYIRGGVVFGAHQLLVNGFTQIDVLMLGLMSGSKDVAVYHVAHRVAYVALMVIGAVHLVTAPSVARHWGGGARETFDNLLARASLAAFILCLCMAFIIVASAAQIERLFGGSFDGAKEIMAVLLVGHVGHAFFGLSDTALGMSKFAGVNVGAFLAANVANVVGNLVMVPRWGAWGAAASSAIALVMLGVWLWAACGYKLGSRFDVVSALLMLKRKR